MYYLPVSEELDEDLKSSLRKHVETQKLVLKQNQKEIVLVVDGRSLRQLVVLETKESPKRLLVVGPKDVKSRSGGKLRIGDSVIAVGGWFDEAALGNRVNGEDTKDSGVGPQDQRRTLDQQESGGGAEEAKTPPAILDRPDKPQFVGFAEQQPDSQRIGLAVVRETTQMVVRSLSLHNFRRYEFNRTHTCTEKSLTERDNDADTRLRQEHTAVGLQGNNKNYCGTPPPALFRRYAHRFEFPAAKVKPSTCEPQVRHVFGAILLNNIYFLLCD
ncbi:unnamed protein product [Caenorhabditis auriculariae]|uniref:Uncharacterized protein n=1 Tax=Caenorhabditis auriculariae TaxID=2777116 RepID=A0A8S1HGR5_9PELO|nr:unnamed protein product [Caenorhabditis auriculariae]